jgi:threonine dehydrogenase-like Zn-dependent dehydrogenase
MKVTFIKKYNKVKIVDIPVPKPEGKDVLIRIDACGVCGSDFIEAKVWDREWKRFGHEIAATVVEMGGVSGLSVGDQVVVALSVPCGNCAPCIEENPRKRGIHLTQVPPIYCDFSQRFVGTATEKSSRPAPLDDRTTCRASEMRDG